MSGVSVAELVRLRRERDARLPFEIGAFVALETTEMILDRPRKVSADNVFVLPDGHLRIEAPEPVADADAAQGVVAVLSRLLVAAGAGVPPVLLELVESGPHSGRWSLAELRSELEASLVPLNRGAARRVLSRLLREGDKRPRSLRPPPPAHDVDADLDALLEGRDPEPEHLATAQFQPVDAFGNPVVSFDEVAKKPGQRAMPRRARATEDAADTLREPEPAPASYDDFDLLSRDTPMVGITVPAEARRSAAESFDLEATPLPAAPLPSRPPPAAPPSRPAVADPGQGALGPGALDRATAGTDAFGKGAAAGPAASAPAASAPRVHAPPVPDLDRFDEPLGKSRKGLALVVTLGLLLVAIGVAVAVLRPDVVDRLTGNAVPEEEPAEPETIVHRAEGGTLRVTAAEGAQILYFVGRGPTTAEYLPVGVAHEIVVLDDGSATRSVVPADASWEEGSERPRYELAMQVTPGGGDLDLGGSRLSADSMGTPTGSLGDIRVVTNPPGAKVYLLVGFGEALVEDLPVAEAHELLVVVPGGEPRRLVVGPSDWADGPGGKVAELSAE